MAQSRGRRDTGRGRSRGQGSGSRQSRQSRQPAARGARGGQAAARGARGSQTGYGGRGNGGAGGGNSKGPIIAVIALGGVAVVVLLILVLTSGNKDSGFDVNPVAQNTPVVVDRPSPTPIDQPPPRLTAAEKARIKEVIDRLAAKEPEARRLKDVGFRALDIGDRERAQECWHTAQKMLMSMLQESGTLFETIGDERVELYYPSYYDIEGRWSKLLSDFVKHVE